MLIKRREFLKTGALSTTSLLVPRFLKAFGGACNFVNDTNKVVVVLQMSGGNDGLNTIIPVRNDIYYSLRPRLGIAKNDTLSISDDAGLNPALPNLKRLYDAGDMAILNTVGYPNPNRSHFRSMDIWQTASASDEIIQAGWLGRYLDAECGTNIKNNVPAIELQGMLTLALKGEKLNGYAFENAGFLRRNMHDGLLEKIAAGHKAPNLHAEEQPVDYLYKVLSGAIENADYITEKLGQKPSTAMYPDTHLGKKFKTLSSLICSDINTKVYYLDIGTFDTHTNQPARQTKLFMEMDDAIYAFVSDLKTNNRFNDVLLFTFSEFGRRVKQNASLGTDHGTANNMFLISGGLKKKGLLNAMPDLQNLVDGDIAYTVDFKNVYATVLKKWLNADDKKIIAASSSNYLDFI